MERTEFSIGAMSNLRAEWREAVCLVKGRASRLNRCRPIILKMTTFIMQQLSTRTIAGCSNETGSIIWLSDLRVMILRCRKPFSFASSSDAWEGRQENWFMRLRRLRLRSCQQFTAITVSASIIEIWRLNLRTGITCGG